MPKTFLKNIFCEIKRSLGRFLSILSIVAIGVAFFAGVKASAPDMKYSADAYFDQQNLQDIQIYSTLGLTKDDVSAIEDIKGVQTVQGLYSMDVLTQYENTQMVLKLISLPNDQKVNTIRLVDGRMPNNENECLIEAASTTSKLFGSLNIGDTITLTSGTDTPISDSLTQDTYTIVGTCYTPTYLSYEKGSTNIGSGTIDSFIYVPESNIVPDYYTEIDVLVKGAKAYNTYDDTYFDVIDPVRKRIEDIAQERVDIRIQSLKQEVIDAQNELDTEIASAQGELSQAKEQIESGQNELAQSQQVLAQSRAQLDSGWNEYYANASLLEQLPALNSAIDQITQYEAQLPEFEQGINQLDQGIAQLDAMINQSGLTLEEATKQAQTIQAQIDILQNQPDQEELVAYLQEQLDQLHQLINTYYSRESLISEKNKYNQELSNLQDAIAQKPTLLAQRDALIEAQGKLNSAYQELVSGEEQYQSGLSQIQQAQSDLANGQAEYDSGIAELESQRQSGQAQIDEAQANINDLDGEWIVLDRNSHYSYRDYGACADRMDGIAAVFPVFFFMVAALVCMTTMTRMVDEQRNEIGTLKALGYSKIQIASKYLIYALIASLFGSAIGCMVGMIVFPTVIFNAWNMLYNLENIHFQFQPGLILLASGSVTGITLLATVYSIYSELMEVPSQLMRPKATKAGKKILLERIKPLWNRLSFLHKVTARNIFRYKKRFFMTVIGIAGCSALLVAGFGINDSIGDIAQQQYGNIYLFNASISVNEDDDNLEQAIANLDGVKEAFKEQILSTTVHYDNEDHAVSTHIIEDTKHFSDFTSLKTAKNDALSLKDDGALISQKLANQMQIHVGDTLEMKNSNDQVLRIKINGIFENYVGHHIYMTKNYYDTLQNNTALTPTYMIKTKDQSSDFEEKLGNAIMSLNNVSSVTFYSSLQKNFTDMISSISFIVVVLVISAAALAFVVLYNLSNVNISERVREIATIKVLGFTRKEVNAYVNREGILLSVIGALIGLVIGIGLHHLIMNLAEMDDVMFGRTISPMSYIISFAMTMLFTFIVNLFMSFKLKHVQMVESLKAVE